MASSTISPARSGVAPTSTPQVDWSDPLNRGLAALCAATTGNLLRDIAFGNDAALTASPPWVSAQPRLRTGISFNGSTQLATVPNNARLNTVTAAVTVAVWTNVLSGEGGNSNRVVCRTGPSTTPVYDLYVSGTNTLGSRLTNSSGTSNFNQVAIPSIASSWHLIGMDYDGVSASHAWLDGVSYSLGSIITGALVSSTNTLTIGKGQQGSNYLGIVAQVRIWNRVLAPGEWARLADYPFSGIEAPRRRLYFGASGGAVYNLSMAEAVSALDAPTQATAFGVSVSEAARAIDSKSAQASFAVSVNEAVIALEAESAVAFFAAAITEAATSSDSISQATTLLAAVAEAVGAVDAPEASTTFLEAVAEAVLVSEAQHTTSVYLAAVAEAISALEAPSAQLGTALVVEEAIRAVDSLSQSAVLAASVSELLRSVDAQEAAAVFAQALIERVGTEDASRIVIPLAAAIAEALGVSDSATAALIASVVIAKICVGDEALFNISVGDEALFNVEVGDEPGPC